MATSRKGKVLWLPVQPSVTVGPPPCSGLTGYAARSTVLGTTSTLLECGAAHPASSRLPTTTLVAIRQISRVLPGHLRREKSALVGLR